MEMTADCQLLNDDPPSEYCAPSAKASRSNGPRSTPGTAVQKEEWEPRCCAHAYAHINIYVDMYVVHQPALHEDQNASV